MGFFIVAGNAAMEQNSPKKQGPTLLAWGLVVSKSKGSIILTGDLGELCEAGLQLLVRGDVVAHLTVV